jgi:2-oxoglutarate/2-oxoacid ferredoxin oxidoreductase subunit beta
MIDKKLYDVPPHVDMAWCPGCGNYPILNIVKTALAELGLPPETVVLCSGIGQAAKTPQYIRTNYFNGLHGRALPPAIAIKNSNPALTVIAESGDGDTYGEGGNHFIHTIRKNPNITNIVHNNMVYGLTKGQASPTSEEGMVTPLQPEGVIVEPFNPLATSLAVGATFVARVFSGDIPQAVEIIKKAILHEGYALVDVFQPCVVFNKQNTFMWFKEHTYYLDEEHDATNKIEAMKLALVEDKFPLGVLYQENGKEPYHKRVRNTEHALYTKPVDQEKVKKLLEKYV